MKVWILAGAPGDYGIWPGLQKKRSAVLRTAFPLSADDVVPDQAELPPDCELIL